MGRLEVVPGPSASPDAVADRIRHTFGIANFSLARRVPIDLDDIAAAVLRDLGDRTCEAFRVSARRADKRYPLSSPQIEREVGGRIKAARGWHVDLEKPEIDVRLEFLSNEAFYFFDKQPAPAACRQVRGPGRVPALGRHRFAGGGVADDEARLHRHLRPLPQLSNPVARVDRKGAFAGHAADALAAAFAALSGAVRRDPAAGAVDGAGAVARGGLPSPDAAHCRAHREDASRAGARDRRRGGSGGVADAREPCRGGQVATLPLFRPLIGMDKEEIMAQAQVLGSYPISIIPDQDCCTLFTPRNPATRARFDDVEAGESGLVHRRTCRNRGPHRGGRGLRLSHRGSDGRIGA
jgi:thiamine biosynthesis protein ThiI